MYLCMYIWEVFSYVCIIGTRDKSDGKRSKAPDKCTSSAHQQKQRETATKTMSWGLEEIQLPNKKKERLENQIDNLTFDGIQKS